MSSASHTEPGLAPAARGALDWRAALLAIWLAWAVATLVVGLADFLILKRLTIADLFFFQQDMPVALASLAFLAALRFAPLRWAERLSLDGLFARPERTTAGLAVLAALVGGAGWFLVCHAYPFSMDEFMAGFDAAIFRTGALTATLPEEWRAFAFALQPQFVIRSGDGAAWASLYLPVNALLRAGFDLVGMAWAAGAIWAAVGIAATWAVARRLWPDRPDAALAAAVLLATSTQLLVTAMTPYAMSAHLAFNMAWLWLFLRPGRWSQVAAAVVAVAACGLHQVVFHPLFAAPFVLALWLSRQWGRAAFHTAVYAAAGLAWLGYFGLVLPGGGLNSATASADHLGAGFFAERLALLLDRLNPAAFGLMAKNLFRFAAWQNPLLPALAVVGLIAAARTRGPLACLAAGIALTLAAVAVVMPFQGHGWGYRYLHGFLGSAALLAAFGWMRLTDGLPPAERRGAGAVLAAAAAFSLLVLLPVRAFQVEAMIRPYALAGDVIGRADAEVVLVDASGLFYAEDLVRNDPHLANRPKVIDLGVLTDGQIRELCATRSVAVFDRRDAGPLGISESPGDPPAELTARRALVDRLGCGDRHVAPG